QEPRLARPGLEQGVDRFEGLVVLALALQAAADAEGRLDAGLVGPGEVLVLVERLGVVAAEPAAAGLPWGGRPGGPAGAADEAEAGTQRTSHDDSREGGTRSVFKVVGGSGKRKEAARAGQWGAGSVMNLTPRNCG